jgi:DNA-binding PadR family transcriptional regulator
MNLSRLLVLGLLSSAGPMHGHRIRREAETSSVESWGGVNVGALYRELHRMEDEGLVQPVRSEQMGRRPARTIYEITDEGRRELVQLRTAAWRSQEGYLDPVGVALLFGGSPEPEEQAEHLAFRRQILRAHLDSLTAERKRFAPNLSMAVIAAYRRGELRLAAELEWHDELERILIEEAGGTTQASAPAAPDDNPGGHHAATPDAPGPQAGPPASPS